jgi:hydrogenase nickel incorporation protein HypB
MIAAELGHFITADLDLLIIENVGNLVCPAAFDLGEHRKIALLSVCEGEDKPAKYPVLFHKADLVLLTKTDLVPHLKWNEDLCVKSVKSVNSGASLLRVSAYSDETLTGWLDYLRNLARK